MRLWRAVLAVFLILSAQAFADDTTFDKPKKKAKPRAAAVKPPDPGPQPQCWPASPLECACYYATKSGASFVWDWRACPPVERTLEPRVLPVEPAPAPAPTPTPTPVPTPTPEPEPFRLGLMTWGETAFTGESDEMAIGGRVYADGPIAGSTSKHPLRLLVDLDITSNPGETFDPGSIATFGRSAALGVGVALGLAETHSGQQTITTSLYVRGGFVTAFADEVLDRYHREVEGGVEFAVRLSADQRARFRVGYCRAERAGYIGSGQICAAGEVPIGERGIVLGGNALVNMSRATVSWQHDIFHVYAGLDVTRMWTR